MKKKNHLHRIHKKIEVRPMALSDYDAWVDYYHTLKDPMNKWDSIKLDPSKLTKCEFKSLLKRKEKQLKTDSGYYLSVFEKKSGRRVGAVSAMDVIRSVSQTTFLGYVIHNNFWGLGYGKASALAMIDIIFRDLKLHRVEAGVEPYNRRSIFLAKSIGLRKEGLKKRMVFIRGEWRDLVVYSATCEELSLIHI